MRRRLGGGSTVLNGLEERIEGGFQRAARAATQVNRGTEPGTAAMRHVCQGVAAAQKGHSSNSYRESGVRLKCRPKH